MTKFELVVIFVSIIIMTLTCHIIRLLNALKLDVYTGHIRVFTAIAKLFVVDAVL